MARREGDADSVTFEASELRQARGGTLTHTHPHNSPFSKADLTVAATYGLRIQAIGDAARYEAKLPYNPRLAAVLESEFDGEVHAAGGDRDTAIQQLAQRYHFAYWRQLSEMAATPDLRRLDLLGSVESVIARAVFSPLHAHIVRLLSHNATANGTIPLLRLPAVQHGAERLITEVMWGKDRPYRVEQGTTVPQSAYFTALWGLLHQAAQLAVEGQAAIMRKYLPADLIRAYEYALLSPFDTSIHEIGPSDTPDPLHEWPSSDGKLLSDRIWTATGDMRRMMRKYLDYAVSQGRTAQQMANDLEMYLLPGVDQRTDTPFGNFSYPALRLARTETADAHARAGWLAAQQNPFVTGYRFFTAPSHRCCDICDEIQNGNPYPKDDHIHLPTQHPECVLPGTTVHVPGNILAVSQAFYVGWCIKISTGNGLELSVTPNHPILTSRGWIAAHLIAEGDQVISAIDPNRIVLDVCPYDNHVPLLIEEIFSSFKISTGVIAGRVPCSSEDFHSDARYFDGDVNIVYANRSLLNNVQPIISQPVRQLSFDGSNADLLGLNRDSVGGFSGVSLGYPPDGSMGRFGHSHTLRSAHKLIHQRLTFAEPPNVNTISDQECANGVPADAALTRDFLARFSSLVTFDNVISVERFPYSGHVYNLQSDPYHLYISNGIITHNCLCGVVWIEVSDPEKIVIALRQGVDAAISAARKAVTDYITPLSKRFVSLLFRGRS